MALKSTTKMSNNNEKRSELRRSLVTFAAQVQEVISAINENYPDATYYWAGGYRIITEDLDQLHALIITAATAVSRPGYQDQLWDPVDRLNRQWRLTVRGLDRLDEMHGRLELYFDSKFELWREIHSVFLKIQGNMRDLVPALLAYTVEVNTDLDPGTQP